MNTHTNTKGVPRLRFRAFSDQWTLKRIDEFAPLQRGFDLPASQVKTGNYPVVFSNGVLKTHEEYRALPPGVVTGRSGTIGKVHFIEENYWPHNTSLWVTNFNDNSPKYVYYFYSNFGLERYETGSGVPTLNRNDIHQQKVFVPGLEEQKKITGILTVADSKIAALQNTVRLMQKYKKSIMQALFTQELRFVNENNEQYPDWEKRKLKDVARFLKGREISKSDIGEDGLTECIRYGELYTRYSEVIENIHSKTVLDPKLLTFSKRNDVIMPASGETSIDIATASCVLKDNVALSGDINILRTQENGAFLAYYLSSFKKPDIARLAQGNSVVHLYSNQLKNLWLNLPSRAEQQKIADFLASVDKKIQLVSRELDQAKIFKFSLLQQLFI